jgi:hypothetical protein
MSQVTIRWRPAWRAIELAAMTPAAGPDSTVFTACSQAIRVDMMPPLACITESERAMPRSSSFAVSPPI